MLHYVDQYGVVQIKVNQEELDFELSQDITLGEVLKHIQSWADNKGLFILNYDILEKNDSKHTPIENILSSEINFLNVKVGTQIDLYRDNLNELDGYIDRMGFFLASKIQEDKVLDEVEELTIKKGLEWVIESVSMVTKQLNLNANEQLKEHLKILAKVRDGHVDLQDANQRTYFLESLAGIKNQALVWNKACQYHGIAESELEKLLAELRKETITVLESLEGIAVDLTAGREASALQKIEALGNFISETLSLLYQTKNHQKEKEQLVSVLDELTSALSRGDLVTAADLVDYEIREALEKITFLTDRECS